MLARLAAIALVVAPLPAFAAFMERHDHWTVTDAQGVCAAYNRPFEEFSAAPYAALTILQPRGVRPHLRLHAWPGVFKYGTRMQIEIGIGPGTVLAAEAPDTSFVEVRDPLPDELIREMRDVRWVPFLVNDIMLMFDLSQIDAVLKSLDACVRSSK